LEGTPERVSDLIIAKIYLNLGIIAQHQGELQNSLHYHKRSLEFKLKELPEMNEEIMSQIVMVAYCNQKAGEHEEACELFERALNICRILFGDFTETTAYSMV
jgi:Tfp pilus assembly protein PilF